MPRGLSLGLHDNDSWFPSGFQRLRWTRFDHPYLARLFLGFDEGQTRGSDRRPPGELGYVGTMSIMSRVIHFPVLAASNYLQHFVRLELLLLLLTFAGPSPVWRTQRLFPSLSGPLTMRIREAAIRSLTISMLRMTRSKTPQKVLNHRPATDRIDRAISAGSLYAPFFAGKSLQQ